MTITKYITLYLCGMNHNKKFIKKVKLKTSIKGGSVIAKIC